MKKVITVVVVLFLCVTQVVMTCTELSERLSGSVFQKLRLSGSTYVVKSSRTQYHCAMQCMYDVICASFNYDTATSSCELNYETSTTTPGKVVNAPGWINANKESFPQAMVGSCAAHPCPRGRVCAHGTTQCLERELCVQFEGAKAFYRGTHNVTKSGKTCQRWDSHTPHEHRGMNDSPSNMKTITTMEEAGNRCLTEDNDSIPWCYTTDSSIRWEHCSIPAC
ncbi:apolipoprotein(a)-like [Haliotis rubra]|uniref:apolipoprotein(a)-like n=1 Tax=Haliotis rubra TaxID=36100 RepID=UPI001EE5B78C|nr:apolipoprotein(a)-like [Haliotis rubra]